MLRSQVRRGGGLPRVVQGRVTLWLVGKWIVLEKLVMRAGAETKKHL